MKAKPKLRPQIKPGVRAIYHNIHDSSEVKCANCTASFRIYNNRERYGDCPLCGLPLKFLATEDQKNAVKNQRLLRDRLEADRRRRDVRRPRYWLAALRLWLHNRMSAWKDKRDSVEMRPA